MYKLFLDDERNLREIYPLADNDEWIIVRTYDEFTQTIAQNGLPVEISFDHDLSAEHYPNRETEGQPIDYSLHIEKSGYDCAKWLVDHCLKKGIDVLPTCHIHSANPIGKENIERFLGRWGQLKQTHIK